MEGLDRDCVFLVRHGQTSLNAEGRLRGRSDAALDDTGQHEVSALARTLAGRHVTTIITSPLLRSAQTAEAIADATGAALTTAVGLTDRDFGEWAGAREADVIRRWGSVDQAPGVETLAEIRRRSRTVLEAQIPALQDGNVVLVSHQAVNELLLGDLGARLLDGRLEQRTGCWNQIRRKPNLWVVELVDQKSETPSPR